MATTSQGLANSLGRVDGALAISRDELIANCRVIAVANTFHDGEEIGLHGTAPVHRGGRA